METPEETQLLSAVTPLHTRRIHGFVCGRRARSVPPGEGWALVSAADSQLDVCSYGLCGHSDTSSVTSVGDEEEGKSGLREDAHLGMPEGNEDHVSDGKYQKVI